MRRCEIHTEVSTRIRYTQDKGILVEAYSPIAHGELLKNREVVDMAGKYGVSVPQLSIRYTLQLGLLPLPKSANPAHSTVLPCPEV